MDCYEVEWKDGIELVFVSSAQNSTPHSGIKQTCIDAWLEWFRYLTPHLIFLELLVNNHSCFLHTFVSFFGVFLFLGFAFYVR